MDDHSITAGAPDGPLPADDPARGVRIARADDAGARHVFMAGDTYTILVSGDDTAGRFCLIDMMVPDGGGPPPHRHDFEETFTLLEGELQFTCRGEKIAVAAPATINIPANAPHRFENVSGSPVRMLCLCAPAGQDEFFLKVGIPLASRDARPPKLSDNEKAERANLAQELSGQYRTELLDRA